MIHWIWHTRQHYHRQWLLNTKWSDFNRCAWLFGTKKWETEGFRGKRAFIDIRLHPGITTPLMAVAAQCSLHVLSSRPLRLNSTSSIQPEVRKIVQRRRRRTKPWPQWIRTQNSERIGPAVSEICSRTDTQTDRWVDHSTLDPYQGGVKMKEMDSDDDIVCMFMCVRYKRDVSTAARLNK